MEEDNHLAKFNLEKSVRRPKEIPQLTETSYKINSDRYDHKKFPYITFVNNNRKIQVCDMERYFYIIPTHNTGTQKVHVTAMEPKPSSEGAGGKSKKSKEVNTVLTYEEGIYPSQLFPKNLITNVQPKTSMLGRKIYLMICVDSPLFIHRKNDVIKMSIDFKDAPIVNVFYDMFTEKDILSILILTQKSSHNCLIDLRSLRIIKKVVKPGPRMPIISSFICESKGSSLYGVDRDGRLYRDAIKVHDPKLGKFNFLKKILIFA